MAVDEQHEASSDVGSQSQGYAHAGYAASLSAYGRPISFAASRGWVLLRSIANSDLQDATGCYPLFCCQNWSGLAGDLDRLAGTAVSFAAVLDPFADRTTDQLVTIFDRVVPFKTHFAVDTATDWRVAINRHHRYYTRKAATLVEIEVLADPTVALADWCRLYGNLTERHGVVGMRAFSEDAFRQQLAVPGMVALAARQGDTIVAMHLWYVQGDIAYSHLAAADDQGYRAMASYALYDQALQHFSSLVRWVHLGAGAGTKADSSDGLTRFKRGWATDTRQAYFCGRVFDQDRYAELCRARAIAADEPYFPAYRQGEFA